MNGPTNDKGPEGPFGEMDLGLNCHPGLDPGSILGVFAIGIGQLGSRIKSEKTFQNSVSASKLSTRLPGSAPRVPS